MKNKIEVEIPYRDDEQVMILIPKGTRREKGTVIVPFENWKDTVEYIQRVYCLVGNKNIKVRFQGAELPLWIDKAPVVIVRRKRNETEKVLLNKLKMSEIGELVKFA